MERYQIALRQIREDGDRRSLGVTMRALPEGDRAQWIQAMPNVAAQWLESSGVPRKIGTELLTRYLAGLRERGIRPRRAWELEV